MKKNDAKVKKIVEKLINIDQKLNDKYLNKHSKAFFKRIKKHEAKVMNGNDEKAKLSLINSKKMVAFMKNKMDEEYK